MSLLLLFEVNVQIRIETVITPKIFGEVPFTVESALEAINLAESQGFVPSNFLIGNNNFPDDVRGIPCFRLIHGEAPWILRCDSVTEANELVDNVTCDLNDNSPKAA